MKGSITSRGENTWLIRYYLPGTKKQKAVTFKGSREEAELKLADLIREAKTGFPMETEKITVAVLLNKWLEVKRGKVKETTWHKYKMYVNMWARTPIANHSIRKLNPLDIEVAISQFPLSAKTVSLLYVIMKMALKKAVLWKLIPWNPMDAVEPPKVENREVQVWSEDEIFQFLKIAQNSPYYMLFYLALKTGARLGELLALQWKAVDLGRSEIRITQTLVYVDKQIKSQSPKTKKSIRKIPLDQTTVLLLKKYKKQRTEEAVRLGRGYVPWVFWRNETGKPPTACTIQTALHKLNRLAGVPDIHFHCLRHTHATILLQQGIHLKIVAERLGHETIFMTSRYSHVLPDSQHEAVKALENLGF